MKAVRKKKFIVITVLFAVFFCVAVLIAGIITSILNRGDDEQEDVRFPTDHYLFERADWDADIFEDEEYLDVDHTVMYENGGEKFPLEKDSYSQPSAQIFISYLNAVINGDNNALDMLFTSDYREKHSATEPFTMQRVYGATVTYLYTDDTDGKNIDYYILSYMIMKNDGTFRRDIASDMTREQVFSVVSEGGEWRIDSVKFFQVKE